MFIHNVYNDDDFLFDERLKLEVNLISLAHIISNNINGLFKLKSVVNIKEIQANTISIYINLVNNNNEDRELIKLDIVKSRYSIGIKIVRSEMIKPILLMDGYTDDRNIDVGYLNKLVEYFISYESFKKIDNEYKYDIYNIDAIREINNKINDNVLLFADADSDTVGLLVNNI